MKYLSLCSGIEAATQAWHPLGWEPIAFSEIDPFCCDYLAHHYPDTPNLGSMDNWREWPIELIGKADVLVAGTPCQSFSVAGLRKGLADDRGNLTLIFLEIANAIDDFRRDNGLDPLRIGWENVPGVYSDDTNGFGSLLAGLCGSDAAIEPPRGRSWTSAGVVSGPRRTAAWRTLDAQYFGVAQRRRRCFVFARGGAGNWQPPDALLPVAEGVSRNPPARRETGQDVAGSLGGSSGERGRSNDLDRSGAFIPMLANPLTARMHKGINTTLDEGQTPIVQCATGGITYALTESSGATEDGTGRGTPIVAQTPSQDIAAPLTSGAGRDGVSSAGRRKEDDENLAVVFTQNQRDEVRIRDIPGALSAQSGVKQQDYVIDGVWVRRLTPRECERLQGFPDDATLIPRKNGKLAADGPRYKALGNSMAVPVMRWLGEQIERVMK